MSSYETSATIERAAHEIWAYAADIGRHPEWMSVTDARLLRGDGARIGDRGRERLRFGPLRLDVAFEVVEADPGRRLVWRAADDPRFSVEVALDLEPLGPSRTRARYRGQVRPRGLWRLLGALVAIEGPAGVRRELASLKANIEGATALAPAK